MYGEQFSLVRRDVAAPTTMIGRFFSVATPGRRQLRRRVGAADDDVSAGLVDPLAHLARRDVGLVLVVGEHDLDLLARELLLHVGDRHADRFDATGAVDVGING